jgi:hypothetical protein
VGSEPRVISGTITREEALQIRADCQALFEARDIADQYRRERGLYVPLRPKPKPTQPAHSPEFRE